MTSCCRERVLPVNRLRVRHSLASFLVTNEERPTSNHGLNCPSNHTALSLRCRERHGLDRRDPVSTASDGELRGRLRSPSWVAVSPCGPSTPKTELLGSRNLSLISRNQQSARFLYGRVNKGSEMRQKSGDFTAHCFIWNRSCSHHDLLNNLRTERGGVAPRKLKASQPLRKRAGKQSSVHKGVQSFENTTTHSIDCDLPLERI